MNFGVGKTPSLFGRTKELEGQIDEFLDIVTHTGLIFSRAIDIYLDKGACQDFEELLAKASEIETRADNLRRDIENKLYVQTLIPDLREDVLKLLENVDNIINRYEGTLFRFSIQTPDVPEEFSRGFRKLTEQVINSVESVVFASRAFFRDTNSVRDHVRKVLFFESEADRINTKLQRKIFASDLDLTRKRHLQYFTENIDEIANCAEDVADELAIYAIKRII
ncbi:MAG: putative phosphate transport protein (TIGR00153 family) [Saprospiraceae bacterium]|jgi:predicted phosphate transport protein (TIGR00153 family)